MGLFQKVQKDLRDNFNIDVVQDVVLARDDRAIYYVDYTKPELVLKKIHGKSPLDMFPNHLSIKFTEIEKRFKMDNKYGEVAGKKYYKKLNMDAVKNCGEESNVTFPIVFQDQTYWLRFHLYRILEKDGKTILASCYVTDVSKYLVNEEELYEKTHKDELTRLFNRYTLYYHFELHSHRTPLTGVFFDIDNFKLYNDTYGHDVGDVVLSTFADRLRARFTEDFTCYRLSGDEFYCLAYSMKQEDVLAVVEEIRQDMKTLDLKGVKEHLSISVGVSHTKDNVIHKHEVFIKHADKLMYQSKKEGKDKVTVGEFHLFNQKKKT